MKGTKMKLFAAAAAIGVLVTLTLSASTASAAADKCRGKKIKAIGKKESRLLGCSGKEATRGIAAVEPDCNNKAITKFQTAYDKPGACSDPPSTVCELIADDCRDKVRMALPDGDGTNPSVCESKRLKAAGKKASGKLMLRQGCREGPAGRLGARRLPRQGEHQVHDRLQCPERLHGRR